MGLNYKTINPQPSPCRAVLLFLLWIALSFAPVSAQKSTRDSLLHKIKSLEKARESHQKDTIYIDLLNSLALKYRYYNSDSLLLLSKNALNLSERANYSKGKCMALLELGAFFSDQGNSEKAIRYFTSALNEASSTKNNKLIIKARNSLAGEHAYLGDNAKALNIYLLTIELAEKENDLPMLSILNENIANLYAAQNDYDSALDFYEKVKDINESVGKPIPSAETMSNVASLYADIEKFDYAMFNINQSISIFERYEILDWLAYAYEVKGKIYLKQKRYKWALYWYDHSQLLHEDLDDDRAKIDLLNGMSQAHLGQENDSIAEIYALQGFDVSKKIKSLEGQKDCSKTLYEIGKKRSDFDTALKYHEIYQRLSKVLSRRDTEKSLAMLKVKLGYEKQKQELIDENNRSLAKQRNYTILAFVIFFILLAITFLVYRNQKMQKKLYKELQNKTKSLEENEIELKEINTTKDKLFSIIGHDLRGPIGALQSLLDLFSGGDLTKDEFVGQMPKLKSDVDSISFTLNNLLSWGQTQMNGAVTKPKRISLNSIVEENINLLSKIAIKKSIRLINELPDNAYAWADKNQIDIVVRNLISNALKFTPENGLINIKAVEKKENWEITVRDTGIGMDPNTQSMIFSENSNFTTYGTNNEKGTGLGLSLCKEMVHKNKGEIWVESFVKKGSCFYFTVPKANKKYKKAS
ncbi:tetratricopeptide repeat-containing sensor histidine kinase [Allomuricauda sp. SCSIO 65647]|uniref:tetratricopeptide repeat-containing sensor histidine kinase n=1 Tax=Allomuricauda sp. SCSIO 65647 TaxID=2908843 RepID=UPI001F41CEE2|nr:tetratricopeptide repeat-containing sensor histidine kinase [Muricauda sp. SCSIO 65647]UJH67113.1 tetratricopeptide repeat-containing sensor histidine kinase [Muricauda sp. SCSIO 65647]